MMILYLSGMPFKIDVVCTVTEPMNLRELNGIANVAWKVGHCPTIAALVFSPSGKALDHFLAALCAERAEMNMVAFNVFAEVIRFISHKKAFLLLV
jgi:hypothetical protein